MDKLEALLWCSFAAINIVAFLTCLIDKRKAVRHRWRISESTLLLLSAIGGAFGMLLGMSIFHHKTRHIKFIILVPLFCIIWLAVIILLMLKL